MSTLLFPLEPTKSSRRRRSSRKDVSLRDVDKAVGQCVGLLQGAAAAEQLYSRDDRLVSLRQISGQPSIRFWSDDELHEWLQGAATFDNGRMVPRPILAMVRVRAAKVLRPLNAVRSTPSLRSDGSVVVEPAYDEASGTAYVSDGLVVPDLPDLPTEDDVAQAVDFLTGEMLGEFPFLAEGDRMRALALLLTPFLRPLITGPTPLFAVTSDLPGAGKTLLATSIGELPTGAIPPVHVWPRTSEEQRKLLHSFSLSGRGYLILDNVRGKVQSDALAAVLTSEAFEARILGESRTARASTAFTTVMTGNKLAFDGEIARRTVVINLSDPHPPDHSFRRDLQEWLGSHRGELVRAVLVLARHWIREGKPAGSARLPSFESWSSVVGGVIEAAGLNVQWSRDAVRRELVEFVNLWWDRLDTGRVTPGALVEQLWGTTELEALVPTRTASGAAKALGRQLAAERELRVGHLLIRSRLDKHSKGHIYWLEGAPSLNPSKSLSR